MTRGRRIAIAGAAAAGGTVTGVERDDEGGGAWEADVRRPEGATVEVHLRADLRQAGPVD